MATISITGSTQPFQEAIRQNPTPEIRNNIFGLGAISVASMAIWSGI